MKILVTGADGLLGSNLVRRLLERDHEVRVFIYPGSTSRTLDGLDVEKITGDITDARAVEAAADGCESVFHVAASTAMWPPRDPKITAINVKGTRNVLDAVERAGVRRLVHVGSASSFGYGAMDDPGTEESPYRYAGLGLAYFDSKLRAQKMVLERARSGRVDAVVVNPTFMFGEHDSGPSSGEIIVGCAGGKVPFYSPGGRNFVHVLDVADGMISALERGRTGECYIMGNRNMSMKELFELVADVAGVKPPRGEAPKPLIMLGGLAGSVFGAVSGKKPPITLEIAKVSLLGCYYSPAKAVAELGMPQTPVERAVEDSYRWLLDNGFIKKGGT